MTSRSKSSTNSLGAVVSSNLSVSNMTQKSLAEATGQSPAYLNHVLTGRKNPSARWCDLIAETLKLNKEQTTKLHTEAAKRHGFKL